MELLEREPLLSSLRGFHADAVGGTGRLVFVAGEAGIGKSALVDAFCAGLPPGTPVHRGFCDSLDTPRALGPLHDIARTCPPELGGLLAGGGDRHALFTAFLDAIAADGSVTVVEDAHWADAATLDLLLFVGRRIAMLAATVVVTYRAEEAGGDHALRRVMGDLATVRSVHRLVVPPLSEFAVHELAERHGRDGALLHAVTGGNAFFVTEVLDAPGHDVPGTVRDAVSARISRLGSAARVVLDAVSLVPDGADGALLEAVLAVDSAGLDEAVRAGILVLDGPIVRFRHELARRVVEADVPAARATELHGRITALLATVEGVDPARLSFHADAAGDTAAVLRYAPAAGRQATELGAHREAAAHFARAARRAERAAPVEVRARLWEQRADACENSYWTFSAAAGPDDLADAVAASERAAVLWAEAGDVERRAVVTARGAHRLWNAGRRADAEVAAGVAVALLDALPPSAGTAQGYTALARLRMLARDMPGAVALGSVAIAHAEDHGDRSSLALALGIVGNAQWLTAPDRAAELLARSLDVARDADDELAVAAALGNLGAGAGMIRDYAVADRWLAATVAWCAERDLDALLGFARAWQARSAFEQARWSEAGTAATEVIGRYADHPPSRTVALTVLGRLRTRRGDPDSQGPLWSALELADRTGDLQRRWPVVAGLAEAAWLAGTPELIAGLVGETYAVAVENRHAWAAGELGLWLHLAGGAVDRSAVVARPWAAQLAGDATGAVRMWQELGCLYEAALARSASDDPGELLVALHELQALGAWPAAEIAARRLRELGVRHLPRRPRQATLDNPAQLTERQVDVLELLADGLRNVDIAARLHISPKTVDHHVSAILAKLGVGSRQEAARWHGERPTRT